MNNENKHTKPDCPQIEQGENIFDLVGIAARTLKMNGLSDEASEMTTRVFDSISFEEALGIIGEYVNVTSIDEPDENFEMEELE